MEPIVIDNEQNSEIEEPSLQQQLKQVKNILRSIAKENETFMEMGIDVTKIFNALENEHKKFSRLTKRLAVVSAESAELMVDMEEKNNALNHANKELARANAHAAELMAEIEIKNKHIEELNKALANANAQASELLVELEIKKDKLNQTEERYRALFDRSLDAVYLNDLEGNFLDANEAALSLLGYTKDEIKTIDFSTLLSEDQLVRAFSSLEDIIETGYQDGVTEFELKRKDGKYIWVETNSSLIYHNGELYAIQGIARDITGRKHTDDERTRLLSELSTKNKELEKFAHIVSHDLKAPLRGISALADWIKTDYHGKLSEEADEQFDLLLNRVKRMDDLIDGILKYSKIGRQVEEKVKIDLNQLVPDVINLIDPPENIDFQIKNKLPTVLFEPTRIIQVFQNLLSNSTKYMDKDRGMITVDMHEEVEKDTKFWKFSISDNGPGIDEKYYDKIFQIFQTLQPRDEVESTGVGLTIVKRIIELYGGGIWVESNVGIGTTFHFTIPSENSKEGNSYER